VRTPLALYALALLVRAVLVVHYPDPAYPDSSYYVDVARQLVNGNGFNVDFIWIFPEVGGRIPDVPALPIPSNAHWMPLASIVQVPFLLLTGTASTAAAYAAAAPFAIVGALAAPLAWALARDAGSPGWVAVGAGVLTAAPALLTPFMAQPDNFGLYQPLVVGALWLTARGLKGDTRAFALAGLLAGGATLARNDGVLVLGVIGLAFLWDRWRAWRSTGSRAPRIPLASAVEAVALFLVVMLPWYARQMAVFGQLSPSTASGKVLFIRDIGEWNSISTPASLDHLLGMGLGPLLLTRVGGLVSAVWIYAVLVGGVLLAPFMLVGAWARRRQVDYGPFLAYATILFAFSAIVSAVHVPGGTFIHSACALVPYSYVLALEGIRASTAWVARRRPSWDAERSARIFGNAAVGFGLVLAVYGSFSVHLTWDHVGQQRQDVAGVLDQAGAAPDDRLMSIDAAGYRYWTGHGGVVLVNDPLDVIEDVARAYDIRWLALERGDAVASVAPILDRDERPAWIGPPAYASQGTDGRVDWAVYPVCTTAGDDRCGAVTGARP